MTNKELAMSLKTGLVMLFLAGLAGAQSSEPAESVESQIVERQIRAAGRTRNLGVLENALDRLDDRLSNSEGYARRVYGAFAVLYSSGTSDLNSAHRSEQKYVLLALERHEVLSTVLEIRLALRLSANVPSPGENSSNESRTKLGLLFHAWRRMEQDTMPNYDFSDQPFWNVAPPPGSASITISGMTPEMIHDSRKREEYLAAIEQNRVKAVEYRRQTDLRDLNPRLVRHVENFALTAINTGAVSESELLSALSLVRDDRAREEITTKIRSAAASLKREP